MLNVTLFNSRVAFINIDTKKRVVAICSSVLYEKWSLKFGSMKALAADQGKPSKAIGAVNNKPNVIVAPSPPLLHRNINSK